MNQATVHRRIAQNVGGKDPLYGSSASSQSTSFHLKPFGVRRRVPRSGFALLCLLLWLVASGPVLALPAANKDGKRVTLSSVLVPEKRNVLFFHAPWSKVSSRYKVQLEKWARKHPEVSVLQVNVKSLKSPVAKQFKLKGVPEFAIYDAKGKLVKSGQDAHNEVVKLLSK